MATINEVISRVALDGNRSWVALWETLTTTNDTGRAITLPAHSDRSVQITGTFGVGGTVVIQGSNDGTNFVTLNDFQGNALSFTAEDLENISQATHFIRPFISGGDGTTDLDISLLLTGAL